MPSEPLPDFTPPPEVSKAGDSDRLVGCEGEASDPAELPVKLSEFSQRLASFGLGETPDPLLTEARPAAKRRSRS
jgi:hypothetical protein